MNQSCRHNPRLGKTFLPGKQSFSTMTSNLVKTLCASKPTHANLQRLHKELSGVKRVAVHLANHRWKISGLAKSTPRFLG
jgi:hypothetical protein